MVQPGCLRQRGGYARAVRCPYAHNAVVELEPGGDERALGAEITVVLCDHWEHEPPCPLAPHPYGREARWRSGATEDCVRGRARNSRSLCGRIGEALAAGELSGRDGHATRWRLVTSAAGPVRAEEANHASRLAAS
jgi:hypothetical protein